MRNPIELMEENTQHIFLAETLGKLMPNDGPIVSQRRFRGGLIKIEACKLYKKKSMEPVPAFIVSKGEGPFVWTKQLTKFAMTHGGEPFIFTNGLWEHNAYVKTVCSNLTRKFLNVRRSTMICVRNINSKDPDRVLHDIFKVVEVTCDNG